jgi:predicted flap endonuclease-1-like 5' DNA nuclease
MTWKQTLGKPGDTYIIGKRWLKKQIPKSKRYSKANHKESCPGTIYDIGERYLPENPAKSQHLWICMETGAIITKTPKVTMVAKPRPPKPKVISAPKPKKVVPKVKKVAEPVVEAKPEPKVAPVVETVKKPSATKSTSVSEIKGIGKAAFEKLTNAGINTIDDLLGKHSQEIATLIGRKSDAQIKKWQDNALAMLE